MGMQNYAKFKSNVVSDSIEQISSRWYYDWSYWSWLLNKTFDLFEILLQIFIWAIAVIWFVFIIFFFFYIIISLFSKWWEKTMLDILKVWKFLIKYINKTYFWIINFIKNLFKFFWNKKILTFLVIFLYFWVGFTQDVINWQSRYLKLEKINTWYVWVDLWNNKILQPGYHLYSPLNTSIFLSPTQDFDFEIAEVTANTLEELWVTLDYRVWFKLVNEKRLSFYNKYWAKNIRIVSSDIVMPKLLEVIKWTIKNYWFRDISLKRNEVKNIILKEANILLNEIWISLQDITIIDIRLPKSYLASKEELLKSENELKLAEAKFEAQKKESEKKLLEAENLKKVKIIDAEAIAEYNRIINSEKITQDMLKMKELEIETIKIKKWDWKLPNTVWDNLDF